MRILLVLWAAAGMIESYFLRYDLMYRDLVEAKEQCRPTQQEIAEVTMLMPLLGENGLADIIFPEILPEIEPKQEAAKNPNYTGLIVDARELGIVPAMSPKVIDNKYK